MNSQFSAEVYHTLVNGGFFIGVVVQLSICLRRVVAGRSTHPVDWTHGKLLMLRGCKIAIGLLTAVTWVFTFLSVQRVASPLSHGIIVDEVGLPRVVAQAIQGGCTQSDRGSLFWCFFDGGSKWEGLKASTPG